jgi:hypothetical protein
MTPTPKIGDVLDYLRGRGWTMTGHWRGATVWSLGEFDVLVPPTDAMADTPGRLRELVNCVADSEGRTPRLVRRDIALPAVDIVSYRARGTEESITLPAGVRSLRAAQQLVSTSAQEVVTGPTEDANALLERTFVELSEVFGIDIGLPYEQGESEPLGRRTALHVLRSSTVVLEAVRASGADAAEQVFRMGVSESFCAALADLAGQDRRAPFELGFQWSRRAPLENAAVEFPTGAGERIQLVGRRSEPPPDVDTIGGAVGVVEGLIRRLSDDEYGDQWRIGVQGVLRVDGTTIGRRRVVPVLLGSAEDYDAALMAHRQGQEVRARGVLTSKREITTADDDGFSVIPRT